MNVKELKEILNRSDRFDSEDVQVVLNIPSVGGHATSIIKNAYFGFDWDKGLLLTATDEIAPKSNQQSIFEESLDLLVFIACNGLSKKKQSFEERRSINILLNNGYTEDNFKTMFRLYQKDKEMKTSISSFIEKNK